MPEQFTWRAELDFVRRDLERLGQQFDRWLREAKMLFSGLPRCTAALAMVPVVARHYPDVFLLDALSPLLARYATKR